jgi:hypothetical protein
MLFMSAMAPGSCKEGAGLAASILDVFWWFVHKQLPRTHITQHISLTKLWHQQPPGKAC